MLASLSSFLVGHKVTPHAARPLRPRESRAGLCEAPCGSGVAARRGCRGAAGPLYRGGERAGWL